MCTLHSRFIEHAGVETGFNQANYSVLEIEGVVQLTSLNEIYVHVEISTVSGSDKSE